MEAQHGRARSGASLVLGSIGIVFGDIGTSPLYTLKTVLALTGEHPPSDVVLGVLSLIIWTLTLITTIKYVALAMNFDNDGEGGILALMALLALGKVRRPAIIAVALFGAALIYGDGIITPPISVLSALEGLTIQLPSLGPYIMPMTIGILIALFWFQSRGTSKIGRAFGPIMLCWFACLALLGLLGILKNPSVLLAVDPLYAIRYLSSGQTGPFLVLGGVFLCVTGAEALYADMGHFGARPIRRSWFFLVYPSLILNYAGQSALVLGGTSTSVNVFYQLCPPTLLLPLVVLATIATIIASQAIITGAFSMTRQAIHLGWLPRLRIVQTSAEGYGQIYVPVVNWLMMIATICLTLVFKKSDSLAAAYGIAVSATMLMTSGLLFLAMRQVWNWTFFPAALVAGVFLVIDATFLSSNLLKIEEGGYIPLLIAASVYGLMYVWHTGVQAVDRRLGRSTMSVNEFVRDLLPHITRVSGTGVFLTRTESGIPPTLLWHVRQNKCLHDSIIILSVRTRPIPRVPPDRRFEIERLADGLWRAKAEYGFMERADIPRLMKMAAAIEPQIDFRSLTYYVGRETIIPRRDHKGIPRWIEESFAFMQRNSEHATDYFKLPPESVVELGRLVNV